MSPHLPEMTPRRVSLVSSLVLILGLGLIVVALGAFDVRFGLASAGVALLLTVIDLPRSKK